MRRFDYKSLIERIKNFGGQKKLAEKVNMSEELLSLKLNNHYEFKQHEIVDIQVALGIDVSQIYYYFFRRG